MNNSETEAVEEYIYLEETQRRINAVWAAYAKHKEAFKSKISNSLKKKVSDSCVLRAKTYGAET